MRNYESRELRELLCLLLTDDAQERFTNKLSIFLGLVTPLVEHHTKTRSHEGMGGRRRTTL